MIIIKHSKITPHMCSDALCRNLVSHYINSKYSIVCSIEEYPDENCDFDPGGMCLVGYEKKISIEKIDINLQFLDLFVEEFRKKKISQKYIDRGFVRFGCMGYNLCVTVHHLTKIQKYIEENPKFLNRKIDEFDEDFYKRIKKK